MTVTAPPRPQRPSDPVTHGEFDALVEALIEEARQRGRRRRRRNAAVVTLVALVGVALFAMLGRSAQSQTASPALSARSSPAATAAGSKIAYISELGLGGGYCGMVWTMNADGSGQRRLTNGGTPGCAWEWGHGWSPDGRIAFVTQVPDFTNQANSPSEIHVMNADGSGERTLVNGVSPAWSPDARTIAFLREYGGGLHVINADGSGVRRLTQRSGEPVWSPDGRRIAFKLTGGRPATGGRPGSRWTEIYVVNADGSGQRRLTRYNSSSWSDPAWSPDGRRIAFGRNWQVWVMNADGSGQQQLTRQGVHNFNPAWSPDGTRIAFERGRRQRSPVGPGSWGLSMHIMNADGSGQRELAQGASQPGWSPDGRKIAFVSKLNGDIDIFVMNADGSGRRNLTRGAGNRESQPLWSPAVK